MLRMWRACRAPGTPKRAPPADDDTASFFAPLRYACPTRRGGERRVGRDAADDIAYNDANDEDTEGDGAAHDDS